MLENPTHIKSMLVMSLGLLCSICSDFFVKALVSIYPVSEITFFRSLTRVIVVGFIIFYMNPAMYKTRHLKTHLTRAILSIMTTISFFYAYRYNSFTEIYAISYSSVMFNVLFSIVILRERVSNKFFFAIMCGIIGIFLALKPDSNKVFQIYSLLPLFGAVLAALNRVFVKKLTFNDHPFTIALYSSVATVVLMPFWGMYTNEIWRVITDPKHVFFLCSMGVLSVLSQYLIINAVKSAQNAFLAPCDYFTFIFITMADYFLWGYSVTLNVFLGATLIIIGNSYIIYQEYKHKKKLQQKKL